MSGSQGVCCVRGEQLREIILLICPRATISRFKTGTMKSA